MASLFRDIQAFVAGHLEADAWFADAGIDVIAEFKGDIATQITTAIGQLGYFVVVNTVVASCDPNKTDVRGPSFEKIEVQVSVGETRAVKSAGTKTAAEIAERVLAVLFQYAEPGVFTALLPDGNTLQLVAPPKEAAALSSLYLVKLKTTAVLRLVDTVTVADPVIVATNPAAVTISCSTAGAAIWYTTDGSMPAPNGTTSTRYTGAFDASAATKVRARAGRWGAKPSDLVTATL